VTATSIHGKKIKSLRGSANHGLIEGILKATIKPKERQTLLIAAVCRGRVAPEEFIRFFEEASDVEKGSCADALKHISELKPELLKHHFDVMIPYVNYKAPRVKWGIQETIGNLAKKYPVKAATAIPRLLRNTVEDQENSTVIRWCAAYALSEIIKHNAEARKGLLPKIRKIAEEEKNNGVKGVYMRAIRSIERQHTMGVED
jgi:hypothetical protein